MSEFDYNSLAPLWETFRTLFPQTEGVTSGLSSLAEGTPFDGLSRLVNAFKYNSGVRPLHEGDSSTYNRLLATFTQMSGIPSETPLEGVVRTGLDFFVDDRSKANAALKSVAQMTGANLMSFAHPGYSHAEVNGSWNTDVMGDFSTALARTMADTWLSTPDDNVSKGIRQQLLAQQMGSDTSLIQANAMARQLMDQTGVNFGEEFNPAGAIDWERLFTVFDERVRARDEDYQRKRDNLQDEMENTTDTEARNLRAEEIAGLDRKHNEQSQATDELKESVKYLAEFNTGLRDVCAAAADWGKMLKTDANTALSRVSDLLGVNAAKAFSGEELGYMTHILQNSAYLGGVSVERVMNMAGVAQEQLEARGLDSDSSFAIASVSAMSSMFGNDYRSTRNAAEKADIITNTQLINSSAGTLYRGAFQAFVDQHPEMNTREAFAQFNRQVEQMGEVTLPNMQRIVGRNFNMNRARTLAQGTDAAEMFAKNPEGLVTLRTQMATQKLRRSLNRYDYVGGRRVHLGREYDRLNRLTMERDGTAVSTAVNRYNREELIRRYGADLGSQLSQYRSAYRGALVSSARAGEWGPGNRNLSADSLTRLADITVPEETAARMREAQARSDIQADYTSGGFGRVLFNAAKQNPDITLGDMASIATGMTLNANTVRFLGTLDKSSARAARDNLADLFSSEEGYRNRYDNLFLAGVQKFDKLRKDGVNDADALKASGLESFGFGVNGEGSLTFDPKDLKGNADRHFQEDKTKKENDSKEHKDAIDKLRGKYGDEFLGLMQTADRMSVYDVFKEKIGDSKFYDEKKKDALDKYQKAWNDYSKDDNKDDSELREAEKAMRAAFRNDPAFNERLVKNRSELGIPSNGTGIDQLILNVVSTIAERLLKGEPLSVRLTGIGNG